MIDESDWSQQDLGMDTTSGTQLHQTLPWGGLARVTKTAGKCLQSSKWAGLITWLVTMLNHGVYGQLKPIYIYIYIYIYIFHLCTH